MATNQPLRFQKPVRQSFSPEEAAGLAERHLGQLSERHRIPPAEARGLSVPRLRRLGRWEASRWERWGIRLEWLQHVMSSPHHRPGWVLRRWRLQLRSFISLRLFLWAIAAAVVALVQLDVIEASHTVDVVVGAAFGLVVLGAVVATWNDLVQGRYQTWRLCRRLAKRPESVLPTTSTQQEAELTGRDERMLIVPREELYDDVLPGIVDRHRKDVQVLVGEPGAGKTTALVGLSQMLARMRIVPVVVSVEGGMGDLVKAAKERFKENVGHLIPLDAHREQLWEWLRAHQRLVIAVDDVDRVAPDGERGFILRRALEKLAAENLPAIVTTRPAGIPAGLAASAISLEELEESQAVEHVIKVVESEPGALERQPETGLLQGKVEQWVAAGRFAEIPFYLELLARVIATGHCEDLGPARAFVEKSDFAGRVRRREDGTCEWNPLAVRFWLLERFYEQVANGNAYQRLAIEKRERASCLKALSEAALATLVAGGLKVGKDRHGEHPPKRFEIKDFLNPDDRSHFVEGGQRKAVSAHEVIDAGERLYILDRAPDSSLRFRHRIMQSYLAARCLQEEEAAGAHAERDWLRSPAGDAMLPLNRLDELLEPRHPERLSAHMTLTFAALRDLDDEKKGGRLSERLLERLVAAARGELPAPGREEKRREDKEDQERLDPRVEFDPEDRKDPDDALTKLCTAATIARVADLSWRMDEIVDGVQAARGATMWTKLLAIPELAALEGCDARWKCMWEFAQDADQEVRRAASEQISEDAQAAYRALAPEIEGLLTNAALRSSHGFPLDLPAPVLDSGGDGELVDFRWGGWLDWLGVRDGDDYDLSDWTEAGDIQPLRALGWVLPAIVSGLREHPTEAKPGSDDEEEGKEQEKHVRAARESLDRLVTLAFQGKHAELEAAVAQGFRSDAMRHARMGKRSGPGLVMSNRRLLTDVCLHDDNAHYWYARMVLHQALALYTVAGSDPQIAFDVYGRLLHDHREPHPLTRRALQLSRRAVGRHKAAGKGWEPLLWEDEGIAVSRRPTNMNRRAAQLVADVTLLLNLYERAPEDRHAQFPQMRELPYCLHRSSDRLEILGSGCPPSCSYGLCPLRQPPPDEPSGQRTVSRGFCRGQQQIARHHKPPWDRRIGRKVLVRFWKDMEQRARM